MNENRTKLAANLFFALTLAFSALLNLGLVALIYWRLQPTSDPITLHYNIYFGPDYTGPGTLIYVMPGFGLAVWLVNAIIAWYYRRKDLALSLLVSGITLLLAIFLFVAGVMVVLTNI